MRPLHTGLVSASFIALLLLVGAACAPASASGSASAGSNGYDLKVTACWGGGPSHGLWLENWGEGAVTVRYDLSRFVYPDGSEHQAISELDLLRHRETGTFQPTVRIGPMQEGMIGMVSASAQRFDERVGGWVRSSPAGTYLNMVIDTPRGRVVERVQDGC